MLFKIKGFSVLAVLLPLLMALVVMGGCDKDKPKTEKTQSSNFQWVSYQKGMELGKKEQKNILISFTADWCMYCEKMDGETFADKDVSQYLQEHYIAIRVDADQEEKLATEYRVEGLPVNWFIDEAGEKIAYLPGYIPPEMFLPILKFIVTDAYKNMTLEEYLKKATTEA